MAGGVETLFGAGGQSVEEYADTVGKSVAEVQEEYNALMEAQGEVFKNAAEGYKTAGLSENEYMETITSFAASLKQSCDSELEAAEAADQAVIDMADNANKMGTSMELIQNAYQGFAKQNYTMLDNLKLGYGGTKEEMARLLEDAEKLTGIKYDINNLSDVYSAIHVIQDELGITGTTAKEASSTISGSLSMVSASWSNLLTAVADENAEFDTYVDEFVDSVAVAAENILPRVEVAINGVGSLIESLFPVIMDRIPEIIDGVLPNLIQSGINIISYLMEGISTNLSTLTESLFEIAGMLMEGFVETFPEFIRIGMEMISSILSGIVENMPLIMENISIAFSSIGESITSCLPEIIRMGGQIILQLVLGIAGALPQLIEAAAQMILELSLGLADALPELIPAVVDIVLQVVETLIDNIDLLIDAAIALIEGLAEGLIAALPKLIEKVPLILAKLTTEIINNAGKLVVAAQALIDSLVNGIMESLPELLESAKKATESTKEYFLQGFAGLVDVGTYAVEGIWQGISNGYDWICGKLSGWVDNVLAWIKKKFGIHSPSTLMRDEVGKYLAQGVFVGFEEEDPMGMIEDSLSHTWGNLQTSFTAKAQAASVNYGKLGDALANSLEKSGLTIQIGEREFGRVVRKVISYG